MKAGLEESSNFFVHGNAPSASCRLPSVPPELKKKRTSVCLIKVNKSKALTCSHCKRDLRVVLGNIPEALIHLEDTFTPVTL